MTFNFLLYLIFWAAFVLGSCIVFRICAAAVHVMDETMPTGCPPQLRRLTWTLATVWSIAMFSEGILQSGYLLDPVFPPQIQTKPADDW
ncbi:MAG: hypothetical protein ACTFAL_12420 [Candidatus Electronema sp. V4]|uniref:hypothetical protein n=1 Tax=Candidatus Electronema sp. V4 TaxID=3454756 RepID=UPI00405585C8